MVWDRHNLLYAHGPLDKFSSGLRSLGFDVGGAPSVGDHMHHYRQELDGYARDLLAAFEWSRTPLHDEDEQ